MNLKVVLLVLGLLIGGVAGWLTAPTTDVIRVGPVSVEVQSGSGEGGTVTATGNDGQIQVQVGNPSPLDDRNTRTLIFAVIGAIVGLGAGFVVDRQRT